MEVSFFRKIGCVFSFPWRFPFCLDLGNEKSVVQNSKRFGIRRYLPNFLVPLPELENAPKKRYGHFLNFRFRSKTDPDLSKSSRCNRGGGRVVVTPTRHNPPVEVAAGSKPAAATFCQNRLFAQGSPNLDGNSMSQIFPGPSYSNVWSKNKPSGCGVQVEIRPGGGDMSKTRKSQPKQTIFTAEFQLQNFSKSLKNPSDFAK